MKIYRQRGDRIEQITRGHATQVSAEINYLTWALLRGSGIDWNRTKWIRKSEGKLDPDDEPV